MRKKLLAFYRRHGELLRYLIIGGMTTAIDIVFFALFTRAFHIDYRAAKALTWVLAVAFAFCGSKWVVFRSRTMEKKALVRETVSFTAMRLLTLLFSEAFLYLTVEHGGWDENMANVLCNVAVVILNYVLSKLVVFRKRA